MVHNETKNNENLLQMDVDSKRYCSTFWNELALTNIFFMEEHSGLHRVLLPFDNIFEYNWPLKRDLSISKKSLTRVKKVKTFQISNC